ncbi:MAG TPA: hypothetical protein VGS21_04000, partial [Acidimicrobiales bacterium]|nr:hypothetical protein [Acidimicrobiales bacterium]
MRTQGSRALLATALIAVATAACGSSNANPPSGNSTTTTHPSVSGTANVAYAGSLSYLSEKVTGPAFVSATGYKYTGQGNGALA